MPTPPTVNTVPLTRPTHCLVVNSELVQLEKDSGLYVIVNVLLHTISPNRGNLWKSLMRAHMGNYEELDAKIKKLSTRQVQ